MKESNKEWWKSQLPVIKTFVIGVAIMAAVIGVGYLAKLSLGI